LWQEYRDVLEFAFTSGENELDRLSSLQLAQLNAKNAEDIEEYRSDRANVGQIGSFIGGILTPFAQKGISSLASALF
jgi:hypothetical protein